ncbi:MAG TPA: SprT-like domain-containing protein [Candidatus Acidoferrales bacterium]|nr:SprT-like domain-containing protein [Candidatus Acidoferrales bacterium]
MGGLEIQGLQSSLFFETPEEIYARVFRELKPRTTPPVLRVEFCKFANADSSIRLDSGRLDIRMSDLFAGAPSPVIEALAYILLGKLYRKPVPRVYTHRYRLYMNRKDVRRQAHLVRQIRGRKFISGPRGEHHDLQEIFEELNARFFDAMLGQPQLGWSRRASRSMLGHFDPSHNAIIISRIFDRADVPALGLQYVMFHEMLHLRYPVDHAGAKRRVHTKEFREAEKKFPQLKEAKELLKRL